MIICHFINYCYNSDIKIYFLGFQVGLILSCMFHIEMQLKKKRNYVVLGK